MTTLSVLCLCCVLFCGCQLAHIAGLSVVWSYGEKQQCLKKHRVQFVTMKLSLRCWDQRSLFIQSFQTFVVISSEKSNSTTLNTNITKQYIYVYV